MPFDNPRVWQPLDLAPLPVALAYDLYVCRRLYPMMAIGLLVHLARLNAEPFADSELWLSDELLSARSGSPSPLRLASAMGRKIGASLGRKQTLRREPRKHRTSTGLISTAVIRLAAGMVESEH